MYSQVSDKWESYLDLNAEQQKLVQHLLLHEYLLSGEKDETIIKNMQADLKVYEKSEMYETCQLYTDAIKLLEQS